MCLFEREKSNTYSQGGTSFAGASSHLRELQEMLRMDTPPNTSPTEKTPFNFLGTHLPADNPFPLVAQWRSTGPFVQHSRPSDPSNKA
jgi:hypothetical protein